MLIFILLLTLFISWILFLLSKKRNPIIISIDGNIGSGKSTLLNILKRELNSLDNIIFLQEPISEWLNINDGETNILDYFYKDKHRWSYTFQILAFITRSKLLHDAVNNNKTNYFEKRKIIITERSTETDKNIFAKMLYDQKFMSTIEYKIYEYWYRANLLNVMNVIYLRTSPEDAFNRIKSRARNEENNLPFDYIQTIHNYHDQWLVDKNNCTNICYINGTENFLTDYKVKSNIVKSIEVFIHSLQSRFDFFT